MELYACGFNAHNQLNFNNSTEQSPRDIYTFRKILSGTSIRLLFAGWSCTVVEVDGALRSNRGAIKLPAGISAADISSVFGDHTGVLGALTVDSRLLVHKDDGDGEEFILRPSSPSPHPSGATPRIAHLAISGSDEVCISPSSFGPSPRTHTSTDSESAPHHLHTYPSFTSLLQSPTPTTTHSLPQPPAQITSNANTFTALLPTGSIYTWGDPRHQHLGRTPTPTTPAQEPGLVTALDGVPIRTVASGGWMTAAVSRDGDLYVWGRQPPGMDGGRRIRCLPGAGGTSNKGEGEDVDGDEGEVALVDIDGGVDVVDLGVGAGHVLALTRDGRVFGVGENKNGQIGVGEGQGRGFYETWIEVPIGTGTEKERKGVVWVDCGYWSSFVLLRVE